MSFHYVVVCDHCFRQQRLRAAVVKHDGGGVFKEDLPSIGWIEEADGRHSCPFCANPCPECGDDGKEKEKS